MSTQYITYVTKESSTNDVYEIEDHVLWDVLCDVQVIEDIRMMKAINKEWYTTCVQKLDVEKSKEPILHVRALSTPCGIFPPGIHIHGKNFSNLVCI
jgi:hypothetical protein